MDGHSILNSKLTTYALIVFGCDGWEEETREFVASFFFIVGQRFVSL